LAVDVTPDTQSVILSGTPMTFAFSFHDTHLIIPTRKIIFSTTLNKQPYELRLNEEGKTIFETREILEEGKYCWTAMYGGDLNFVGSSTQVEWKIKDPNRQRTVCIFQSHACVPSTSTIWKKLKSKAQENKKELIKVHESDFVKRESPPQVLWDVTIWIGNSIDLRETNFFDQFNQLPGTKKLAILLNYTSNNTNPNERPEFILTNKPNIFSFLGGSFGLHPKAGFQIKQEVEVLNYIFS